MKIIGHVFTYNNIFLYTLEKYNYIPQNDDFYYLVLRRTSVYTTLTAVFSFCDEYFIMAKCRLSGLLTLEQAT